jgi:hypothetical protein
LRLGQGRENVRQFLRDNRDVFEQIRAAVIAIKRPVPKTEPAQAPGAPSASVKAADAPDDRRPARAVPPSGRRPIIAASRKR